MMMKRGFNAVLILFAVLVAFSCNNNRSYTDMLNAEKKAIDRWKDENNIEILKEYPKDGVFKENQFVVLDNGVYLNVVDSGNGNRAVSGSTTLFCRFTVKWILSSYYLGDTATVNNIGIGTQPIVFKYGSYTPTQADDVVASTFFCTALYSPLEYVGDSSEVKLLIPFEVNDQGSIFRSGTDGIPLYYKRVLYRFDQM
jgi:hypothetical protein